VVQLVFAAEPFIVRPFSRLEWRCQISECRQSIYAIRRHDFDRAFRSNSWLFHSSVSIRVEVYEVLLSCTLIICYDMYYVVSIPAWCMMRNICVYFMWDVFIMDFYVYFDWDPFVFMMARYSFSPCVRLCDADKRSIMSGSSYSGRSHGETLPLM